MRRLMTVVLVLLAVLVGVSACTRGGDTTQTTNTTGLEDPWGVAKVVLPVTMEEVTDAFNAMPVVIDGMDVSRDEGEHVGVVRYSGPAGQLTSISQSQLGPDAARVVDQLTAMSGQEAFTATAQSLEATDDLVWLEGVAEDPDGAVYVAMFGDPSWGWLFQVDADSADHRDAVIEAFVSAVSS